MTDTTAPRTAADFATIRERHFGEYSVIRRASFCNRCDEPWRCDAAKLAEAIEPLLAMVRAVQDASDAWYVNGPNFMDRSDLLPVALAKVRAILKALPDDIEIRAAARKPE